MPRPNDRDQLTSLCLTELAAVAPELDRSTISATSSLTDELMLDSFVLATFIEKLEQKFSDVDMTPWFMTATRGGQDTIEGLVDFILAARASAN